MQRVALVASLVGLCTGSALAQTPAPTANPYSKGARAQFDHIQTLIMRSAEKIGDDLYSFKPTPEVRSVAGVLGHIADGNNLLCGVAAGKADIDTVMKDIPAVQVNEKKTGKAEIVAALKESRANCEAVYDALTDANGQTPVKWFTPEPVPKLMILTSANSHAWEHYGNLVTYMRLKGIVPPSSENQPR